MQVPTITEKKKIDYGSKVQRERNMDIKLGQLPGKIAWQDGSMVFVKLDGFFIKVQCSAEAYIEPSRISAMKLFLRKFTTLDR